MKKNNLLFGLVMIACIALIFFASPASSVYAEEGGIVVGCAGGACEKEIHDGFQITMKTKDNGVGSTPRYECCKEECHPNEQGQKSGISKTIPVT